MKRTLKPGAMLAIAFGIFVLVLIVLTGSENTIDITQSTTAPERQKVSVEVVHKAPAKAQVVVFSEVKPRWQAVITSSVSGRVTKVHKKALAGGLVNKGDVLVEIESSEYLAALRSAQVQYQQAELDVRKAENATAVAKSLFRQKGTEPPNDMAIHLPELNIAKSQLISAAASVEAAQKKFDDTRVIAPFDGIVAKRMVSLGQSINQGDQMVELVDAKTFELKAKVNKKQWQLLADNLAGHRASVLEQSGEHLGFATVREAGRFLDEKTRQHLVFLDIENTVDNTVMAGDFVQLSLTGKTLENTINIPASALSQKGFVWFVDQRNQLQRFSAKVLFRSNGRVYLSAPSDAAQWRIAITPLASFLPGQLVAPSETGGRDA